MKFLNKTSFSLPFSGAMLKGYWPVYLFWAVLFSADTLTRLVFGVAGNYDKEPYFDRSVLPPPLYPVLDVQSHIGYLANLSRFEQKKKGTALSDSEVSGEIFNTRPSDGVWRLGQYDYRLLAVFGGHDLFAVLYRSHSQTGHIELVEARVGDHLEGFLVEKLSMAGLMATHPLGETKELLFFQPSESASGELGS